VLGAATSLLELSIALTSVNNGDLQLAIIDIVDRNALYCASARRCAIRRPTTAMA
jgi:hypothetical protein